MSQIKSRSLAAFEGSVSCLQSKLAAMTAERDEWFDMAAMTAEKLKIAKSDIALQLTHQ